MLGPEVVHQKMNVELMKNIIIRVKYQESRIGCENLAYFQSIENKCKLNMTKFILVKDKLEALSKLALLPWLQIYHDNEENRRASSDSLMDGCIYVGKVSPFYPDRCPCYHTNNQFVSVRFRVKERDEWKR